MLKALGIGKNSFSTIFIHLDDKVIPAEKNLYTQDWKYAGIDISAYHTPKEY